MLAPASEDLEDRKIVWDALHCLWLDTDVDSHYLGRAIKTCAQSKYSISELKKIYWTEVYPIMRFNLMPWGVAGEWCAVDTEELSELILKKTKYTKIILFKSMRRYAYFYWVEIRQGIIALRETN